MYIDMIGRPLKVGNTVVVSVNNRMVVGVVRFVSTPNSDVEIQIIPGHMAQVTAANNQIVRVI